MRETLPHPGAYLCSVLLFAGGGRLCDLRISIMYTNINNRRPGQDVKQSIETVDAVWQGIMFIHYL